MEDNKNICVRFFPTAMQMYKLSQNKKEPTIYYEDMEYIKTFVETWAEDGYKSCNIVIDINDKPRWRNEEYVENYIKTLVSLGYVIIKEFDEDKLYLKISWNPDGGITDYKGMAIL